MQKRFNSGGALTIPGTKQIECRVFGEALFIGIDLLQRFDAAWFKSRRSRMRSKAVFTRKFWPTRAPSTRATVTVPGGGSATLLTDPVEPLAYGAGSPPLLNRLFFPHLDSSNFFHGHDDRRKVLVAVTQASRFQVYLLRKRRQ